LRQALARLRASGKARAFGIHLGISSCAVGVLALLMLRWWYPPPFFMFDGGWQVLRLIVLVDVVLGPLLTLIVFNRAKPELRRDLAIIALLQLAAFTTGAWVMVQHRPAFMVYAERSFYPVSWPDVRRATPDLSGPQRIAAAAPSPAVVVADFSADRAERARLLAIMTAGGPAITHYGAYYRALSDSAFARIVAESVDIAALAAGNPEIAAELKRVLARHAARKDQLVFVPLDCRYGLIMLVFDRESRAILDWMT
jgi:hypothetical protein